MCLVLTSVSVEARTHQVPDQFETIQQAIFAAQQGDTVQVAPGSYTGGIDFLGKAITVEGVPDSTGIPILMNPDDFLVSFCHGEDEQSVLRHFVIRDSFMGVFVAGSSPTLHNLTIINNRHGIGAYAHSFPDIRNCIFWENLISDASGCQPQYSFVANTHLIGNQGLVGFWPFDREREEIAFDSLKQNNGRIYGGYKAPGLLGHALSFEGVDNYADFGLSPAFKLTEDISVSLWVNRHSERFSLIGIETGLEDIEENNADFYLSITTNGRLKYIHEYGEGLNQEHNFAPLPEDQWVHVAVVRDSTNKRVSAYYDGVLMGTYDYVVPPFNPNEEIAMALGGRSRDTDSFQGQIDEVAIYSHMLSPREIQQHYLAGLSGLKPVECLVAENPLFADPDNDDYHLRSERGRYAPEYDLWIHDTETSACLDLGDPMSNCVNEPAPNGNRINMGAYGGTAYASIGKRNQSPHVQLAPPIVVRPNTILCEAYAWDADGLIQTVRWYLNDGSALHADSNPADGWRLTLENLDPDNYTIWCTATDDQGKTVISDMFTVPISEPDNSDGR